MVDLQGMFPNELAAHYEEMEKQRADKWEAKWKALKRDIRRLIKNGDFNENEIACVLGEHGMLPEGW